MAHVLIAVGCDLYDHTSCLAGAENDACAIHSLLTNPMYGDADGARSVLVKSPTTEQLKGALMAAIGGITPGDIVSFFFAGHGAVKNGVFYMCMRDTRADRIAVTAFPLNNLLSLIQEMSARHANIVIDACNSGGIIGDFKKSLSPDSIGDAGSLGISLLAACARNQLAQEINGVGVCTAEIVACIKGTSFVQDLTPSLDLSEIGGAISQKIATHASQQPVFWGLNLTGRPNFCLNPHVSADSPMRRALAEAGQLALSLEIKREIQDIHSCVNDSWEIVRLQRAFATAFQQPSVPSTKIGFANQVLQAFRSKAKGCDDPFREIEVTAACLSPLLSLCAVDELAEAFVTRECCDLADLVVYKTKELERRILADDYALLGEAGVAELYLLPIRISKILGWLGWASYVRAAHQDGQSSIDPSLIRLLLDRYSGALRCMSDAQAPHLLSILGALRFSSTRSLAEELVGYYFADASDSHGAVAPHDLDQYKIIRFLTARASGEIVKNELAANPSSLLFSVMYAGAILSLDDAFDAGFEDLDHRNINAYIPDSYASYFAERIATGFNATLRVGHDAWNTADIRTLLDEIEFPKPETLGVAVLSAACSLIYPDRVAWHLMVTDRQQA